MVSVIDNGLLPGNVTAGSVGLYQHYGIAALTEEECIAVTIDYHAPTIRGAVTVPCIPEALTGWTQLGQSYATVCSIIARNKHVTVSIICNAVGIGINLTRSVKHAEEIGETVSSAA